MWILPDYPHTTKWLSEEERAYAAWRLIEDIQEADTYGEQSILDGVKMAVRDYRLYIFVLMQHVSLISQTFQYFFPTIVGTLGYGKITTLWLTAPAWVSLCSFFFQSEIPRPRRGETRRSSQFLFHRLRHSSSRSASLGPLQRPKTVLFTLYA